MAFQQGDAQSRCLTSRVDALVVAFQVVLAPAVKDELEERQGIANEAGRAALRIGSSTYELKRSRKQDVVAFRNADVRGVYDPLASGGWALELVATAAYLATHALEDAIDLLEQVAREFGQVEASRLRRFDLCADYVGFPLRDDDSAKRVLTTRARTTSFVSDSKDVDEVGGELCKADVREYRSPQRAVTGLVVAPGNPLMARIYDKTAELGLSGREHKREIEHARLRAAGWDGVAPVTRVEFQHRGRYLDEVQLRSVRDLPGQIDAVWQRDVTWMRLIQPETSRRPRRCKSDARWQAVAATVFRHEAAPIGRQQLRGDGARPSHVRGSTLSFLGTQGELQWLAVAEDGEVLDEGEFADLLSEEQQKRWLRDHYRRAGARAGELVAAFERARYGSRDAVARAIKHNNATKARFSNCGDAGSVPRRRR